jgi:hypothetical protein
MNKTANIIQSIRSVGRPRKIESPERMHELIDSYIDSCAEEGSPVLLTGMILHMGLACRASLDEYQTYSDEFSYAVKRAKLIVQIAYEMQLSGGQAAGPIFALKNMGWSDQQRIDLGNADDKPFEVSGDVDRAARLGSLLAVAQARREAEEDDGEDLA